jgi:hypothetical protein
LPGVASARPLTSDLRAVLAAFALLALTAGILLFGLAEETDRYFSWTIQPPLTAAFLGAAYWSACVLIGWTARQSTWEEAIPALVPVSVIAVLLLATTLIHLDKFDFDSVFGWFWLIVYAGVPPLLALLAWRQSTVVPVPVPDEPRTSIPGILRGLLAWQAVVMSAIGIALWVAPSTEDTLWPWTLTPLTGRAVGSFLIGFAAAAAFAVWDNRLARFHGAAYAYATLGALELLAAAIFSEDFAGDGGTAAYVAFAGTVLAVGVAGSFAAGRAQRR